MYEIWTVVLLMICAVTDIKERKVYTPLCFVNSISALIIHLVTGDLLWTKIFLGMIVGAVFYLISVFTKESVGKGDSIVIFTLGCIAGAEKLLLILLWAFILCTVVSLIGIALRKLSLKARVPFIPFVLAGEIVTLII